MKMSSHVASPVITIAPGSFEDANKNNNTKNASKVKNNNTTTTTTSVTNSSNLGPTAVGSGGAGSMAMIASSNLDGVEPYTDDKSYMEDAFFAIAALIKTRNAEGDMKDEDGYFFNPKTSAEAQLRELKGKERLTRAKLYARLEATRRKGGFMPKIEQLGDKLNLSTFEKLVLLLCVGAVISQDILIAINGRYVHRDGAMQVTVGYTLFILCETLTQRIGGRRCFAKDAPLIKSGLISINPPDGRNSFNADLVEFAVDVDRKIVDEIVGLETSPGELVQGSKLYTPAVTVADVVLPEDTKKVVMSAVHHYHMFTQCTANCGLAASMTSNASALVFLFAGPSGTGKTLLANALAAELKKKILLVNALAVRSASNPGDVIRFLFREARLNSCLVFFDECETLFESRVQNPAVTSILAEFELFDGVVILATNRPGIVDSAMDRRVSVVVEFKNPDHKMRREIWNKHLPAKIELEKSVNLEKIALNYELSGGLIKNAVLAAIRSAVEREKSAMPKMLTAADIESGAKSQLRGLFHVSASDSTFAGSSNQQGNRILTPSRTLSDIVLDDELSDQMDKLIRKIKSRNVLFSQWGFDEGASAGDVIEPLVVLLRGGEGSGKSLAAEIIAHECALNMRVDNLSAMILKGKDIVTEMQTLFDEARNVGAAVVLDGAEEMFGSGDQADQTAMLLQYHANKFRRPILLLAKTNAYGSGSGSGSSSGVTRARDFNVDPAFCAVRFSDVFTFTLPNRRLRERMWRNFIPSRVPLGDDISWSKLAEHGLSAKSIRAICFNACSMAAMMTRSELVVSSENNKKNNDGKDTNTSAGEVRLTMSFLEKATKEFFENEAKRRSTAQSMFM